MPVEEQGRLKYIGAKVALLTAAANGDSTVSVECMQAAKKFVLWQSRLRELFRVGVAPEFSLEAQFTETFLAAMKQRGADKNFVKWKKVSHDRKWGERYGPRIVNSTVENLIKSETIEAHQELEEDEQGRVKVVTDTRRIRLRRWNDD